MPARFVLAAFLFALAQSAPGGDATSTARSSASGPSAAAMAGARVWLLRHAEAGEGHDPALTPAGAARADHWHATLGAPALRRVYANDTRRSRETAGAIAADAGARLEIYDAGQPEALLARLRERAEPALVVAHSNTLNPLAAGLGAGPDLAPIAHDEHDRVHELPLAAAAEAEAGASAPATASDMQIPER